MSSHTKGVLLIISAAFFLTITSTIVKYLDFPIYQKIFFRNIIGVIIIGSILKPRELIVPKEDRMLLAYRLLLGLSGMFAYYYSIERMVLSDAATLQKLSVFFIAIYAFVFLGEKLDKKQLLAIVIAFIGAVFVIKPSFNSSMTAAMVSILSAALVGGAYTLLRRIKHVNSLVIVFYFVLFNSIMTVMLGFNQFIMPSIDDLLILLLLGLSATMGQISVTKAYTYAPASDISIYNYTSILFAIIFSFIFFNVIPDVFSLTGAALIVYAAYIHRSVILKRNGVNSL